MWFERVIMNLKQFKKIISVKYVFEKKALTRKFAQATVKNN